MNTTDEPRPAYNSMPATWCAARVAEARAYEADLSNPPDARTHVRELLSQLERPAAPAATDAAEHLEAEAASLRAQLAEARQELGNLYAVIFGDGGHRQAELEGQLIPAIDWLTLEPTGELVPALPAAADAVLRGLRAEANAVQALHEDGVRLLRERNAARQEAAHAEREKRALREELRGLRADGLVKGSRRANAAIISIAESVIATLKRTAKGRDKSATFWSGVLHDWCNDIESAFWPENDAAPLPLQGEEGKGGVAA